MQEIVRMAEFDSMHRVMNEKMKCFNVHGHRYKVELGFEFDPGEFDANNIGYAIDFKEIKRVGCQWIDDFFDHGSILNPHDHKLIETVQELESKIWIMTLNGPEYCNPTAENIAKELYIGVYCLFDENDNLSLNKIRLWETPNCYTDCVHDSVSIREVNNWMAANGDGIQLYKEEKGQVEYDDRK